MIIYAHCIYITGKYTGFAVGILDAVLLKSAKYAEKRVIMEKLKIMVVDDEARMRKLVKDFLVKSNFDVLEAGDGEEAVDKFYENKDIALILLDVMMPKMDGWEVVREIRKYSQVPIIMLTAKSDEKDELLGFELGVDEYISKPFSPKILVARVEAILRRSNNLSTGEIRKAGGIELDIAAHEVRIDGKEITLSFKEFELLNYFVMNQGVALSREKILNNVWILGMPERLTPMSKSCVVSWAKRESISRQSGEWVISLR